MRLQEKQNRDANDLLELQSNHLGAARHKLGWWAALFDDDMALCDVKLNKSELAAVIYDITGKPFPVGTTPKPALEAQLVELASGPDALGSGWLREAAASVN